MTPCEAAFVAYFKSVCPDTKKGYDGCGYTDEGILNMWHEFYDDWQVAVRWGQANPMADTTKRKRRVNRFSAFAPSTLYANTMEWEG